ncbi:unnamed protein product [Closterium sp. Naga37s-1]|nr:unnamed protein product [Closterium sp. Naga37s-1]
METCGATGTSDAQRRGAEQRRPLDASRAHALAKTHHKLHNAPGAPAHTACLMGIPSDKLSPRRVEEGPDGGVDGFGALLSAVKRASIERSQELESTLDTTNVRAAIGPGSDSDPRTCVRRGRRVRVGNGATSGAVGAAGRTDYGAGGAADAGATGMAAGAAAACGRGAARRFARVPATWPGLRNVVLMAKVDAIVAELKDLRAGLDEFLVMLPYFNGFENAATSDGVDADDEDWNVVADDADDEDRNVVADDADDEGQNVVAVVADDEDRNVVADDEDRNVLADDEDRNVVANDAVFIPWGSGGGGVQHRDWGVQQRAEGGGVQHRDWGVHQRAEGGGVQQRAGEGVQQRAEEGGVQQRAEGGGVKRRAEGRGVQRRAEGGGVQRRAGGGGVQQRAGSGELQEAGSGEVRNAEGAVWSCR